eukprot:354219-Chlamydomonas_euryale.AAC.5
MQATGRKGRRGEPGEGRWGPEYRGWSRGGEVGLGKGGGVQRTGVGPGEERCVQGRGGGVQGRGGGVRRRLGAIQQRKWAEWRPWAEGRWWAEGMGGARRSCRRAARQD